MFRCHRFTAALFACGMLLAAGSRLARSDELAGEPPATVESWLVDPVPVQNAAFEFKPDWPQTWDLGRGATFKLRGRIDTDAIWSSQSAANIDTFGNLANVIGLRRARIGAEGQLSLDSRYITEIDLAPGIVVPRDVYFAFGQRQQAGETQVGHFREPFSFEGGTSSRYFAFLERSPINLLDPARNWGLGWFHETPDESSTLALGVFHAGVDAGDFQGGDGSTTGFTGRLTYAPINEGNGQRLLHWGVALSERIPDTGVIIINQQPRSPLLDLADSSTSPFVPAINIPASFQQLVNLQFAAARGPLWTQAEWYGTWIDQTGGDWVFFHGCHLDVGYFLSGEHRGYKSGSGVLGSIHVNRPLWRGACDDERPRGWGAWELTSRFTYLDFFDPDTPPGPNNQQIGIQLPQSTFGVNWYFTNRARLMFNYSYCLPDEMNTGTSVANIFATRLAVYW